MIITTPPIVHAYYYTTISEVLSYECSGTLHFPNAIHAVPEGSKTHKDHCDFCCCSSSLSSLFKASDVLTTTSPPSIPKYAATGFCPPPTGIPSGPRSALELFSVAAAAAAEAASIPFLPQNNPVSTTPTISFNFFANVGTSQLLSLSFSFSLASPVSAPVLLLLCLLLSRLLSSFDPKRNAFGNGASTMKFPLSEMMGPALALPPSRREGVVDPSNFRSRRTLGADVGTISIGMAGHLVSSRGWSFRKSYLSSASFPITSFAWFK